MAIVRTSAPPWIRGFTVLIIAAATCATFRPVLKNGFVWDDYPLFVDNAFLQVPVLEQLRWMFTSLDTGHYHPVSWLLLATIRRLGGLEPKAYHLVGLVLHVANTVLVYFLARRLIAAAARARVAPPLPVSAPGASRRGVGTAHHVDYGYASGSGGRCPPYELVLAGALAALLFGLHPLRVEVVAWAACLRDLLCAFFYLSALLCYLRMCEGANRRAWMAGAIAAHILALLSKPMAVSLPAVLLVLDVHPLRRLRGRPREWFGTPSKPVLLEKIPFILLSILAAAIAPLAEMRAGALTSLEGFGWPQRFAQVFYGLVFYLVKTALPIGLSPLYELPQPFDPLAERFVLSAVAAVLLSAVFVAMRPRWPAGLAAWACYTIVLLPVLGLVHIGPFIAADRYTYFAAVVWAVLAAGVVWWCWEVGVPALAHRLGSKQASSLAFRAGPSSARSVSHAGASSCPMTGPTTARLGWVRSGRPTPGAPCPWVVVVVGAAAIAVLATWSMMSFEQCKVWRNAQRLWEHASSIDPSSVIARCNLASALAEAGQPDKAWDICQQVLAGRPGYPPAVYGLGYARANQGRYREALDYYRLVLPVMPRSAELHIDMARALSALGDLDQAAQHYRQALAIWPSDIRAKRALVELSGRADPQAR
jgi:hypothetical protein